MSPSMDDRMRYGLGTTFAHGGGLHREWCAPPCRVPTLGCRVGRGKAARLFRGGAPSGLATPAQKSLWLLGRFHLEGEK